MGVCGKLVYVVCLLHYADNIKYSIQVKLVKCLVQNIVVDVSFNQIGGLCTLCFLEQVHCFRQFNISTDLLYKCTVIVSNEGSSPIRID